MGEIPDEQVGQRWGKVEPALWGRRRYSFTHRTKVFAGGTIRKIHVRPQETCRCPGSNQVSDPISESEMGSDAPSGVGERNSVRWAAHESWGLKSPRRSDEGRCIQKRG